MPKQIWKYRDKVENPPEDSILTFNNIPFVNLSPMKDILERRSYLRVPAILSYIGIASTENAEMYANAVSIIKQAIEDNLEILVWGDYDVDGMTATACLFHCLKNLNATVKWAVPNRLESGYGINIDQITSLISPGSLIVTVDNGIAEAEQIAKLTELGYKIIVTDHHLLVNEFPDKAVAVVNPKVSLKETDDEYMAPGVYVASKLALRLCRLMNVPGSKFKALHHFCACLTAFGIVSDIIDLNHTMRMQLLYGLTELTNTRHSGIKALFGICGVRENQNISSTFLAYSVVPKLNAAGRMGKPSAGVELMLLDFDSSSNCVTSVLAANSLKYLNDDRKIIENQIFTEALVLADKQLTVYTNSLVVYKEDWHPGVIGIIAAKLVEIYNKPTIVLTKERNEIKGSGRAIDGMDLTKVLEACSDALESFGGHAAAAGVNLKPEQIDDFIKRFDTAVASVEISDNQVFEIDADVTISNLYDVYFQMFLENFEPIGKCNPEIILKLSNLEVISVEEKRSATYLLLKDINGATIIVSKYKAPAEYNNLTGKIIDILINPNTLYFTGTTVVEWKIQSIRIQGENNES